MTMVPGRPGHGPMRFVGSAPVEQAAAAAIEAFTDGLFLVVLDEAEIRDLDAPLTLTESSRLSFIRLARLAGG